MMETGMLFEVHPGGLRYPRHLKQDYLPHSNREQHEHVDYNRFSILFQNPSMKTRFSSGEAPI